MLAVDQATLPSHSGYTAVHSFGTQRVAQMKVLRSEGETSHVSDASCKTKIKIT